MQPTPDFDPARAIRSLLRRSRQGALATLMAGSGDPYCSLVNVASHPDGAPILLISRLAIHTKNLLADARVSLMLDERAEGDPLEGSRIMLSGHAEEVTADREIARRRYLNAHPSAEAFVDFKDFSFFRISPSGTHLVAGFGRIVDLRPAEFLTDISDATALLEAEQGAVEHMNTDHLDALILLAKHFAGIEAQEAEMTSVDRLGFNLRLKAKDRAHGTRIAFLRQVSEPVQAREVFVEMVRLARRG